MNGFKLSKSSRIYVAGHLGLVGSAILRILQARGYENIVCRSSSELDLTNQVAVRSFFQLEMPDVVFDAAARVGGIQANAQFPGDFIRDNLQIQTNLIDEAYQAGVQKLLFLGSSCIYPRLAHQPLKEEYLLTGPLESTNEWYAVAKIAGIKMCQAYHRQFGFNAISVMPTNVYGPGDNFNPQTSHVLPGLIRKFHDAKSCGDERVAIWGTGEPRREFLYVDDLADACVHLMIHYENPEIINVGTGKDIKISCLAELIRDVVQYPGEIAYDASMPDGTPRKLLDVCRLTEHGWHYSTELRSGLEQTYRWFLENQGSIRR